MAKLLTFLSGFKRVTLVCHPNADPDCLGSACALDTAIRASNGSDVSILVPEGINTASTKLLSHLNLKLTEAIPDSNDLFVLVDMPSLDQVPTVKAAIEKNSTQYAVVDHHTPDKTTLKGASFSIVKPKSSTCEIVYSSIDKHLLDEKSLLGLLAGLIYDSRRFLIPSKSALLVAASMVKRGADYGLALELLYNEQDISERIAKLKAASRLQLFRLGDWLLASTSVGSYEGSVARSMNDLGADMGLVINEKGDSVRVTGRLTEKFQKATRLNLASDLMRPLAEQFAGQGGGHPSAASVKLCATGEDALSHALALVSRRLGFSADELKDLNTKK